MKKIYTVLAFVALSLQVNAQNFAYDVSPTLDVELTTNTYSYPEIKFITSPATGITFEWETISNDIPAGWTYSLCDYELCYPGIPASGTMSNISTAEAQNGTKGYFKLTITPSEVEGTATVKIYVHDQADQNMGDTVTFNFNHTSSLSVDDVSTAQLSIYPNPANDLVTISNISPEVNRIDVYNITGQLIHSIVPSSDIEKLDVSDLNPGAYFVSHTNGEGIRKTEKLIIR